MNVREEISKVKAGTYVRVCYTSDMTSKLRAAVRKTGLKVTKYVETTGRTGIEYGHIAKVIAKKESAEPSNRNYTNPYEWVIPNRIKVHKDKGTEYFVMGTTPNSNTKTRYVFEYPDGTVREVVGKLSEEDMSIFTGNGNSEAPDIMTIKLENITKFKGKVVA